MISSARVPQELFKRLIHECNQFSIDDVINASSNVLINALRQKNSLKREAENGLDELFGTIREILMSNYDVYGNRRIISLNETQISSTFGKFDS